MTTATAPSSSSPARGKSAGRVQAATRLVGPDDKEGVAVARALVQEYIDSLNIDLSFENVERELAEFPTAYAHPRGALFVAFVGKKPAGVVALRRISKKTCEMKRLYVREEFRGKGVGRALAQLSIQEATRLGYTRMRLDTLSTMKEAIGLYCSLGFREIAPYLSNPISGATFMELPLAKGGAHGKIAVRSVRGEVRFASLESSAESATSSGDVSSPRSD